MLFRLLFIGFSYANFLKPSATFRSPWVNFCGVEVVFGGKTNAMTPAAIDVEFVGDFVAGQR